MADVLNADLCKVGAYNKMEQKNVTAWLDLRNKAAHGHYAEYDQAHVESLVRDVRARCGWAESKPQNHSMSRRTAERPDGQTAEIRALRA